MDLCRWLGVCRILQSMVARVGLGCSLIGMRWPLSLRYSLVPRPPSHFNWCHRIVEWENRPLTQREISERRAWENLSREGRTEVEPTYWCVGTSVNEPHLPHICSRLEASTKFWSHKSPAEQSLAATAAC